MMRSGVRVTTRRGGGMGDVEAWIATRHVVCVSATTESDGKVGVYVITSTAPAPIHVVEVEGVTDPSVQDFVDWLHDRDPNLPIEEPF